MNHTPNKQVRNDKITKLSKKNLKTARSLVYAAWLVTKGVISENPGP